MKGLGDAHCSSVSREREGWSSYNKGQPPLQNTQGAGRVLQPEQNNVLKTQNSWRSQVRRGSRRPGTNSKVTASKSAGLSMAGKNTHSSF